MTINFIEEDSISRWSEEKCVVHADVFRETYDNTRLCFSGTVTMTDVDMLDNTIQTLCKKIEKEEKSIIREKILNLCKE